MASTGARVLLKRRRPRDALKGCCSTLQKSWFSGTASVASDVSKRKQVHTSKSSSSNHITSSTASPYDDDKIKATQLVDNLLEYTHSLMTEKIEKNHPSHSIHHIIAFSGGIDSSVATALVHQVATSRSYCSHAANHSVTAALGISPAVPMDQIVLAEQVAQQIGVDLHQIPTTEGNDSIYIANVGKACLACKTHLYTCLSSIAEHYGNGVDARDDSESWQQAFQLYNGTNADDLQDPTRLGLIAANNFDVKSPLEHTPKALVRMAGRHLGLPNWNYAASPCLRSRLALGVKAIPQHLQTIERAEQFVRRTLRLDPTHNTRVRLLAGNRAMVEVDSSLLEQAQHSMQENDAWNKTFVDTLGFSSLDVRAFRTGSVAKR